MFGVAALCALSVLDPEPSFQHFGCMIFASLNLTLGLWRGGAPEEKSDG